MPPSFSCSSYRPLASRVASVEGRNSGGDFVAGSAVISGSEDSSGSNFLRSKGFYKIVIIKSNNL